MTQTALQKAATFFDTEIVMPVRQAAKARQLISVKPTVKGDGIKAADILKVVEMGEAQMAYRLPKDMGRDMIRIDKSTVNIPILFKGYEVNREEMETYAQTGVGLDAAAAISAAYVIGVQEDTAIIAGWMPDGATYKMPGLYNVSGVTVNSNTYDLDTYGDAVTAVSALKAQLELVHVQPPFNLVLHPNEYAKLDASESATGKEEYRRVISIINGNSDGPGRIFSSSNMTAATGMLTPVDPGRVYMELLNPQPIRNVLGEDSKMPGISDITGTSFEALYVNVKHPAAIGTLTKLNGA